MAVDEGSGRAARAPQSGRLARDIVAGAFLILVAGIGLAGSWTLAHGSLAGGNSGLMPRATSALLALCGVILMAQGVVRGSSRFDAISLRALVLIIGSITLFGATIRPLGLAVAGFVCVVVASLADPTSRLRQTIPFAIVLTASCVLLFRVALRQPIPLAPFILGY